MRILHTSDWHVGKVLKGRNRFEEHTRVLKITDGAMRHMAVRRTATTQPPRRSVPQPG